MKRIYLINDYNEKDKEFDIFPRIAICSITKPLNTIQYALGIGWGYWGIVFVLN